MNLCHHPLGISLLVSDFCRRPFGIGLSALAFWCRPLGVALLALISCQPLGVDPLALASRRWPLVVDLLESPRFGVGLLASTP